MTFGGEGEGKKLLDRLVLVQRKLPEINDKKWLLCGNEFDVAMINNTKG